jgi:urease accessory protein
VATRVFATSPLRLLTPANHGPAVWIYTSSYGGGLVDGDCVRIDLAVEAGAAAFVSTQASTKVYRSPRGTRAELHARVGADGLLIAAPDPVVCFAGARYRQIQRFDVAEAGALVVVDCVLSGRRAAGERWAFAEYHSTTEVTLGGRLLVLDALALHAADGDLARRLGRFDALAIAVIAGRALRAEAERLAAAWAAHPVGRRADEIMTASALGEHGEHGCVLRVAGRSAEQVGRTLREALQFVPARLGDDPWMRKW